MIFISERLDFKDKFVKSSDGSVLFLQNKIIKANSSIQWNTKLQGYLENNNPQSANIIINSGYGSLSKTLKPYEKFQFPYININSITNSSSVYVIRNIYATAYIYIFIRNIYGS